MGEILPRNVKWENRLQYQPGNQAEEIWPFTADVRRYLYLKYAINPEERTEGIAPRDMWEEMAERMDAFKGKRIADIGCGSGYFIRKLLERGHNGPIYGYDTAVSHLELLEQILRDSEQGHNNVRLAYGDAQSLPIEDSSIDAAAAPFIAYHLPRPAKLISEMHRILVPDGLGIISGRNTDNTINLWTIANLVAKEHNATMPSPGSFYSHFPLNQLLQSFEDSKKFELLEYQKQNEPMWIPTNDEGWNDYREAIFSLLPLMRMPDGRQLRKTDVIGFLENNDNKNIRRDYFEALGKDYGGYFPDLVDQGFVVVRNIK